LRLHVIENEEGRGFRSRRKKEQFKATNTKKLRNKDTWRKALGDTGMERDILQDGMDSESRLEGRRYNGGGTEKKRCGKGYTKGKGMRYKKTCGGKEIQRWNVM
jgi:hypothetical protein